MKNIFKEAPPGSINKYLGFNVAVFGLLGAARGLDEGLIGPTLIQPSFRSAFGIDGMDPKREADIESNITSMISLGSILGSILAFYLADKLGRVWTTRVLCLLWMVGIGVFMSGSANGSLGAVYAGRFLAGVGIGQTTVVAPAYLSETAPPSIRGLCVTLFAGNVYVGIVIGYFAAYGASMHLPDSSQRQWLIPTSVHLIVAAIILVGSLFVVESPRWLYMKGQRERAFRTLQKLRRCSAEDENLLAEVRAIKETLAEEEAAQAGRGVWANFLELFRTKASRYRMMLTVLCQLLSQWSGATTITIYAPKYFRMVGIEGKNQLLFATSMFGVTKFISAIICALLLVDMIGRKRSLMAGIMIQFVGVFYIAVFLVVSGTPTAEAVRHNAGLRRAASACVGMIYLTGFGWALGWNSIQYLINSEIFPIGIRAIGSSLGMVVHFANMFGVSKAVPIMFLGITQPGTLFFFSAVTLLGLIWVVLFLPELSGMPLETIDRIFELPWYRIGLFGRKSVEAGAGDVEQMKSRQSPRIASGSVGGSLAEKLPEKETGAWGAGSKE